MGRHEPGWATPAAAVRDRALPAVSSPPAWCSTGVNGLVAGLRPRPHDIRGDGGNRLRLHPSPVARTGRTYSVPNDLRGRAVYGISLIGRCAVSALEGATI